MRVGFVGVGSIGRPMLEQVVAAGHDVAFHARRPEVIAEVEATGATPVGSVEELGARSEVVVVCVFSDDQVREVCFGPGGLIDSMSAGGVVVNHTTCSPETVVEMERRGQPRDVRVIDAPFSGSASDASAGTITLLASGPESVLDQVRPVISSYCDPILRVGDVGDGQRVKLVNNALFGATLGLVVEAERLAEDLGLDPGMAFEAIAHCSGGSYALGASLRAGSARGLRRGAGRYIAKDVATAQALAHHAGTDLGILGVVATSDPPPPSSEA